MTQLFMSSNRVEVSADEVFAWHTRPGALERLLPPWLKVRVIEQSGGIEAGGRVVLRVRQGPLAFRWHAVIDECSRDGRLFVDRQVKGPFAHWVHSHRFLPEGHAACTMEDRVSYRLPMGPVGALVGDRAVKRSLKRMFRFRHERVRDDLARHTAFGRRGPRRIVITGSSGLIGSNLAAFLTSGGHTVIRLVRREPDAGRNEAFWDPATGKIDAAAIEGADAVVHLAGESIAARRWSRAVKERILRSREDGTTLLSRTLARLNHRPHVLISASAMGYYGLNPEGLLDEGSGPGEGFLAEVCRAWEAATEPARQAGIRVVTPRIGAVLSAAGGALAMMLPAYRWGLGGVMGSGRQPMSWIALDDLVGVIHYLLFTEISGPVNAVSPNTVTNAEFTRTLGAVLRRPTVLRVPGAAIRLALGEMGDALLLRAARVVPSALLAGGFRFLYPDLEKTLRHELGLSVA
jgi:uncharacterized protein (TIGR01777 family)